MSVEAVSEEAASLLIEREGPVPVFPCVSEDLDTHPKPSEAQTLNQI